jgi:RimJ/RimL family protein N-acetyltransferase
MRPECMPDCLLKVIINISSNPPTSLAELIARYERISQRHSPDKREIWLNWVIINRQSGAYLGYVQSTLMVNEGWAYIAYHVFATYQRKGVAKQCVSMLIDFLFNHYKLSHVDALIDSRNLASIRLMESLQLKKINELKDADFSKDRQAMNVITEFLTVNGR